MKRLLPLLSVLLATELSGELKPVTPSPISDQAAVVEGNNAFAVDLYAHLRSRDGNLFFSPESISTAFAMAYAGARGETAAQIAHALHFTLPPAELHPAMGALSTGLNAPHDGYQLHVADALWAEKTYTFLGDFLKLTASDDGAGLNQLDFKNASEAARASINQWVEQKTENKIKDLIPPGGVGPTTRLVLTNAIYFKGDWKTQFPKERTGDEDFHLSPSKTITAPLMHLEARFGYFEGETFQAVEIPYKGDELSMIVLLPKEVDGLRALEQSMNPANAQKWLGELNGARKVILTLPKFKMTQEFQLGDTLSAMGMRNAFNPERGGFLGDDGEQGFVDFSGHP